VAGDRVDAAGRLAHVVRLRWRTHLLYTQVSPEVKGASGGATVPRNKWTRRANGLAYDFRYGTSFGKPDTEGVPVLQTRCGPTRGLIAMSPPVRPIGRRSPRRWERGSRHRCRTRSVTWPGMPSACSTPWASRRLTSSAPRWAA